MNIAFNINHLGLTGLGTTLSSLIRNCSDATKLNFWFLCAYLTTKEKEGILKLIEAEGAIGNHTFVDFDPNAIFGSYRSLHGDWTAYGRLLLPDIITEDQVLYLDSDLIIENNVLDLANFEFGKYALGAVNGGILKHALENNFYINILRLSPNISTFNSGVLLFNLVKWRERKIKEACLSIADRYPMELLSADQSLLNAVFAGNFAELPKSFNCPWYPNCPKPTGAERMIIHFVGSPKPWDLFGSLIHRGYYTWKQYANPVWDSIISPYTLSQLKRFWNIRRSYGRIILRNIKSVLGN